MPVDDRSDPLKRALEGSATDRLLREIRDRDRFLRDATGASFRSLVGALDSAHAALREPPHLQAMRAAQDRFVHWVNGSLLQRELVSSLSRVSQQIDVAKSLARPVGQSLYDQVVAANSRLAARTDLLAGVIRDSQLEARLREIDRLLMRNRPAIEEALWAKPLTGDAEGPESPDFDADVEEAMRRTLDSLAGSDSTEEILKGLNSYLDAVAGALKRLTGEGVSARAILSALLAVMTIISFYRSFLPAELSEDDRARLIQLERRGDAIEHGVARIVAAVDDVEAAHLQDSLRMRLSRAARVRSAPARNAPLLHSLKEGETVALTSHSGRWRRIVYLDPVSGELAEGWLYGSPFVAEAPKSAKVWTRPPRRDWVRSLRQDRQRLNDGSFEIEHLYDGATGLP
jgi:hypothetical protein